MALNIKPLLIKVFFIEPVAVETKNALRGFYSDNKQRKPQKELLLQLGWVPKEHTMTVKLR
jgi:hypothetical protein